LKSITQKNKLLRPGLGFDVFNTVFMLIIIIVTLYPFWYCLIGSLNEGYDYIKGGVFLLPRAFSWENYRIVLREERLITAYRVTIFRTVIGTVTHLIFTAVFAYGITRKYLLGRSIYLKYAMFTMYFGGGLIPTYLLYINLNLINSFWVYIIPSLFSFYHVIILQSFFKTIPEALNESAMIDGAGEYRIFFSIIVPLSKPVMAAIALFTGVGHWNAYFDSMVFTTSTSLQTVQVYLMRIIREVEFAAKMAAESADLIPGLRRPNAETIKLATMIVATAPILAIYPFLQKYFVKGIMMGSIKG